MLRILLLILLASSSASGANYYKMLKSTGAYVPLTGDTTVHPITDTSNGGFEYMVELKGTTFNFFGKTYAVNDSSIFIYFSTNGHLGIQTDTSFLIFDALFMYLDSVDNNSAVSYKVEGSGNNRIVKLQWKNLMLRDGQAGNYVNVQLWLYQATGVVEMRYGPRSASNQSGFNSITGPNVGMFHSNKAFTKMYEKIWVNGSPASYTLDSAKTIVFNAMSGAPDEGTIYSFIPAHLLSVNSIGNMGDQFKVYPNPASGRLVVSAKTAAPAGTTVTLTDAAGRLVSSASIQKGEKETSFSTADLPEGIYFVAISSGGHTSSAQVAIRHDK